MKRYLHEKIAFIQHGTSHEHVLIVPGEKDSVIRHGRAKIYTVRAPLVSRAAQYRVLLRLRCVADILEQEKPDLLESADPYQLGWLAVACGRELRIPVVAFYHSHFAEAYVQPAARRFGQAFTEWAMDGARRYTANLYNRCAATLVPSPALAAELRTWGVANTRPADLGADMETFSSTPNDALATRAEMHLPIDRLLLLYVGRLAPEKNTHTLFEAFEILTSAQPGRFHLLVVGDGPQRQMLAALQAKTGAVTGLDYCTESSRLARIYRAADLFVHPGVLETFGLAALESQACGTPVVGIRGTRMDRIIFGGLASWAEENSARALAEAVERMSTLDLPALGKTVARESAARFSWPNIFRRLFAIYDETVANFTPPR